LGLHRRQSLIDNFKDENDRNQAVQVFWVVYELDRRWSFGTSLSFALNDRDIDPQLPEPGRNYPYLKCMVAFARLCSRVWEAMPTYGSSLQVMPSETEDYLDFMTQNWLASIPEGLRFEHPRLGTAANSQPRQLQRLRTLLYLRGNYMRTLIHRHHVLTTDNIKASLQSAQVVVDIAKDTVLVLVHLCESSDIYIREQSIYHYYLLSALAVVLLAVCHAPNTFAESCRDSFVSAVELVKGFSRHSTSSRRLWKSVRSLLPVVKSLSSRAEAGRQLPSQAADGPATAFPQPLLDPHPILHDEAVASDALEMNMPKSWTDNETATFDLDLGNLPDIYDMSNNLLDFYDVFGAAATEQPQGTIPSVENYGEIGMLTWEMEEVSRHFQGLL
jgi:hypothetical protein